MYFLAIVAKQDVLRGNIVPSYILCKSKGDSDKRSPWRIYRANESQFKAPKVLVKWPIGNDILVDFMSSYRTRDHMHGSKKFKHEKTKKYTPEGALFWFECNQYGDIIGPAVFVKNVPEKNIRTDSGKTRAEEALSKITTAADLFSNDPFSVNLIYSGLKPRIHQGR